MSLRFGEPLTEREWQCLDAVCREGLTNGGAGVKLSISTKTVDTHLAHARIKLGAVDLRQMGYLFALAGVRERLQSTDGGWCPVCRRGK